MGMDHLSRNLDVPAGEGQGLLPLRFPHERGLFSFAFELWDWESLG